jgi:hypothetical protein
MKISLAPGWTAACAVGFGLGFPAHILLEQLAGGVDFRTTMLAVFGSVKDPVAMVVPLRDSFYTGSLLGLLAFGTILGIAQSIALRGRLQRMGPWMLTGAAGFLAICILAVWPLHAAIGWGKIAGPVEPIVITLGGGSFVAVLQWLYLRKLGFRASRWLGRWTGGLAVGLLIAMPLFIFLEDVLGVLIPWGPSLAILGVILGTVAGVMSGQELLAVLDGNKAEAG